MYDVLKQVADEHGAHNAVSMWGRALEDMGYEVNKGTHIRQPAAYLFSIFTVRKMRKLRLCSAVVVLQYAGNLPTILIRVLACTRSPS